VNEQTAQRCRQPTISGNSRLTRSPRVLKLTTDRALDLAVASCRQCRKLAVTASDDAGLQTASLHYLAGRIAPRELTVGPRHDRRSHPRTDRWANGLSSDGSPRAATSSRRRRSCSSSSRSSNPSAAAGNARWCRLIWRGNGITSAVRATGLKANRKVVRQASVRCDGSSNAARIRPPMDARSSIKPSATRSQPHVPTHPAGATRGCT
jgi:hypothetical protein